MKKMILSAALALACTCVFAQTPATVRGRLEKHLGYLASDELCGRRAGSEDARKAAEYIAGEFAQIGLKPFNDSTYYAFFDAGSPLGRGNRYCDVIGVLEGNDPALKDELVIIGAHYDHLGVKDGEVYNGADDNASGVSALIEVARSLASRKGELQRTVLFAAFDAEEIGLYGSSALAQLLLPDNAEQKSVVRLMISADMVGWLKASGKLKTEGVGTLGHGREVLGQIAEAHGINLEPKSFEGSLFTATDTQGFASRKVPTLAVTTGLKSPYHKPEDDVELIDFEGLEKITGFLEDVVLAAASGNGIPASGRVAKIHRGKEFLEFGAAAGVGNTRAVYPKESALAGKTAAVASLGLAAQLNFGRYLALRPEAYFEAGKLRLPSPTDQFTAEECYHYGRVVAPVSLLLKLPGSDELMPSYMYLGGGVNYSRDIYTGLHASAIKNSADPFGWHWIWGMNLKKAAFEVIVTRPLGGLGYSECEGFGNMSSRTSQFRLVRWF